MDILKLIKYCIKPTWMFNEGIPYTVSFISFVYSSFKLIKKKTIPYYQINSSNYMKKKFKVIVELQFHL